MALRIAAAPIEASVAVGDGSSRAPDSGAPRPAPAAPFPTTRQEHPAPQLRPPASPGEAFAAAVIAGQLPPRPTSLAQLRRRLGSAWQPPASPLRLTDKTA